MFFFFCLIDELISFVLFFVQLLYVRFGVVESARKIGAKFIP